MPTKGKKLTEYQQAIVDELLRGVVYWSPNYSFRETGFLGELASAVSRVGPRPER